MNHLLYNNQSCSDDWFETNMSEEEFKILYYPQCQGCGEHTHPDCGGLFIDYELHPDQEVFYCNECINEIKINNESNN